MGVIPPASSQSTELVRLLLQAQQGSNAALGSVLEACRSYLLAVANEEFDSKLQSKAGASDLVQDTFCEACRDFDQFNGVTEEDLLVWLRGILRHNLDDFLRRYRRAAKRRFQSEVPIDGEGSQTGPAQSLISREPSPSSLVNRDDQARILERALTELPEEQRRIVLLRNRDGLKFHEIGKILDRSPDAARMSWYRAIQRLTSLLGCEDGG
jgi:RNA polymerase sigma-70 factor (ECF subfamily)